MKNITLTRKANTVSAPYLPYSAYKNALALATTHKGEIGSTAEGFFKATFKSVEIAKKFVSEWTADYNAHRKADAPTPTPAKKTESKPTTTKGKKAPRKTKGNAIDFTQFQGTKSEKNRALHAMLVSKGITNSKSEEYMSVWNARPWAK